MLLLAWELEESRTVHWSIMWNVAEHYTEETLSEALANVDFRPPRCRQLNICGAWIFHFAERSLVNGFLVALDDTTDIIEPLPDTSIRTLTAVCKPSADRTDGLPCETSFQTTNFGGGIPQELIHLGKKLSTSLRQ